MVVVVMIFMEPAAYFDPNHAGHRHPFQRWDCQTFHKGQLRKISDFSGKMFSKTNVQAISHNSIAIYLLSWQPKHVTG